MENVRANARKKRKRFTVRDSATTVTGRSEQKLKDIKVLLDSRKTHLCDVSIFMSACRKHHNWIHDNHKQSVEMGYLIQKVKKD